MARPIAVDLFAGAGGLSLGFEQAGFDVVAAVEIDPIHAATHHYNFPNCAIFPRSIAQITACDIRAHSAIGDREIDVVFGGPPCQGFSLMGQRQLDDSRNRLVLEFLRLVTELQPACFLLENVKGLTVGNHRQFLQELVAESQARGYQIRLPWRVLNAAHYGVPQDRDRLFLLGARQGRSLPDYPAPITASRNDRKPDPMLPLVASCWDALADLPEAEDYAELLAGDNILTANWGKPSSYAQLLRCLNSEGWYYGYQRRWESSLLTASARTNHTSISRQRFAKTILGSVEPISRFFKLAPDGISNTLRAGTDSARGAFTSPRPIHYAKNRCITVREMARLHGFPDWFRFHQTKLHGARQVGNAVPPPLARTLALSILQALTIDPAPPSKLLDLGSPYLLGLDMTAASAHWHIEIPIRRRDRKSGVKKPKQSETPLAPSR
jgi:DNA (cytosine-5)-methyltransferase 1